MNYSEFDIKAICKELESAFIQSNANANLPVVTSKRRNHGRCVLDRRTLRTLCRKNPAIDRWVSESQGLMDSMCRSENAITGNLDAPLPQLVFELHSLSGMSIFNCYQENHEFPFKYSLKILKHLQNNRQLLAALIGSVMIRQSLYINDEVDGSRLNFSIRESTDPSEVILMDFSCIQRIDFPALAFWHKCGLGWLLRDYPCCPKCDKLSHPWRKHECQGFPTWA